MKAKVVGAVREATYYFRKKENQNTVYHILFHLENKEAAGVEIARKHFLASFGEPDAMRRRDMLWKATDREWVVLEPDFSGTYSVYPANATGPKITFRLDQQQ